MRLESARRLIDDATCIECNFALQLAARSFQIWAFVVVPGMKNCMQQDSTDPKSERLGVKLGKDCVSGRLETVSRKCLEERKWVEKKSSYGREWLCGCGEL